MTNEEEQNTGAFEPPTKETDEERAERLNNAKIRNFHKQGVKAFHYGEEIIWARNQKNADKKAKKKGIL